MATYTTPSTPTGVSTPAELQRKDTWWVQPVATTIVLILFIVYSTWRAFEGRFYDTYETWNVIKHGFSTNRAPLLWSPFYSPHIPLNWHIGNWPISPALYVLIFPLSFRLTCYYCRRSYYRAFFWDPPACAVQEIAARRNYSGEREFPFVLHNLHRFTWYAAVVLVCFHWKHLFDAFFALNASGVRYFSPGLGTLIFAADTLFLTAYTFSCHSWRHLIGGGVNRFSQSSSTQSRGKAWSFVSWLNGRHGLFFWLSLITVAVADFYVRALANGLITDFHLF